MRHEQLAEQDSFDVVEPRISRAEAAAPDVPASVGILLAAVYVGLIGILAVTIANRGQGLLVIAVDLFFLGAFLTVPAIFLRLEGDPVRRPSLSRFLSQGIETYTGHISGGGAIAQMFVVPVLLSLGVLAIGIIAMAGL
jgi:hypothetical protein